MILSTYDTVSIHDKVFSNMAAEYNTVVVPIGWENLHT